MSVNTWWVPADRRKRIWALSVPIILGMMSQTLLNIVDTLMVSTLGATAIAAVGFGSFANFLGMAFVTGLSAGVQAMASRRKGEGREQEMAVPLNGGLLLVAIIAIPLSTLLIFSASTIFSVLSSDQDVIRAGVPYLQIRLVAMIAIGSNYAFRGYWNGVDLSKLYLRSLLVMHLSNVVLSYVLIFGELGLPAYGSTGAAIGTAASAFIGTAYYFFQGKVHASSAGFMKALPSKETLVQMLRLSFPSGLQSLLYAAGLTAMFMIVDRIGTFEVAAMNVLINITMVAFLPGLGMGLAAATLVGQALGKEDADDAELWGWQVAKLCNAMMLCLGLPMAIAPELILSAFLASEPEALALAILPLRISGATIWVEATLMVLLHGIIGAGATKIGLAVSVGMQWGLFLPAAFIAGPVLGFGLLGVWIAEISYRALQSVVLMILWKRRVWSSIKL